jgi:hypothetical protein
MPGPVQPVAIVEALLLRTKLPEVPLRQGATFLARVASRAEAGGRAALVIAGELVPATVPPEVHEGQTLRLTVAEVGPERIVLRMDTPPQAATVPPPPPPPLRLAVEERPGSGRGPAGGEDAVALRLDLPALGSLRIRVTAAPGAVAATIQVPAAVLEPVRAAAGRLREDLAAQTGRPAAVHVVAGSVDIRA